MKKYLLLCVSAFAADKSTKRVYVDIRRITGRYVAGEFQMAK